MTPKHQTSSLPLDLKDFEIAYLSLTLTSLGQHTLSPLPYRIVNPRASPARIIENSLAHPNFVTTANVLAPEEQDLWPNVILPPTFIADAAIGERPKFDNNSSFSDNSSVATSLESGRLELE